MSAPPRPSRTDHFVGATEMASTEFLLYQTEDGQVAKALKGRRE